MTNARVAAALDAVAGLLEEQGASPHRVRAWREGARAVRDHPRALDDVFRDHGRAGLEAIPRIGAHLAAVIIELLRSGRSRLLDRLRGEVGPIARFAALPGVGELLAERIHHALGVSTLEDLEQAAHDGRLAAVPGFGPRRVAGVRDVLATRLARRRPEDPRRPAPPVALLLEEDRRYRTRAAAGELPRIAPRRFNPGREAWLPILHEERDGWALTVVCSNTALAHKLGRTGDWVVVYAERDGEEARATVVTETRGPLAGERVVRGREAECARYYASRADLQGVATPLDDAARGL